METRENLKNKVAKLLAKAIKDASKNIKGNVYNYSKVSVELNQWSSGFGRNSKWSYTEVVIGSDKVKFTDRELDDREFISLAKAALEQSKCKGEVLYDECGDGYWMPKTYYFKGIRVYGEVCKEFNNLNKLLKKYGNKTIEEHSVFYVDVCGKRSSWSDTGRKLFLDYAPKMCARIIDYINHNRLRGWKVAISTDDFFSHGDEMDYKVAQYQESEWYGTRGTMLVVDIKNSKGENKLHKTFMDLS